MRRRRRAVRLLKRGALYLGALVFTVFAIIPFYWMILTSFKTNRDLYVGLLKALINGVCICTVACHQGFSTSEGAVGVGQATRRTVIISFLTVLVFGYIVSRFFYR